MYANRASANRLSWLAAAWGAQKGRVAHLLGRLASLGAPGTIKPKILHKFFDLLGQVAAAKDEEMKILCEIEAVEKQHRFMRKNGYLKRAEPAKDADCIYDHDQKPPPRFGILWFIAFWLLMTRGGIKNKSQRLTLD